MADESVSTVSVTLQEAYQFLATFNDLPDAAPIILDERPPVGTARGPNAEALLAAAIGNCLASSLLFCLRRSRVDVTGLESNVKVHVARSEPGRLRVAGIEVELEPRLAAEDDSERLERCRQVFEDFCIVTASVRKGIDVQVKVSPPQSHLD